MGFPRCHGFMVIDTCLNREGGFNSVWIYEWQCLNWEKFLMRKPWRIGVGSNTKLSWDKLKRLSEFLFTMRASGDFFS
jgi:hypothetical protein